MMTRAPFLMSTLFVLAILLALPPSAADIDFEPWPAFDDGGSSSSYASRMSLPTSFMAQNGQAVNGGLSDFADPRSSDDPNWRERVGPAHPGDFWRSLGRDVREIPLWLWDNTKAYYASPTGWVSLGAAGATSIIMGSTHTDRRISGDVRERERTLNRFWNGVGEHVGKAGPHFALAATIYTVSTLRDDDHGHGAGLALFHALSLNGLTTLALKGTVNRERPGGGNHSWPSGHTSSSFTMAAVMYDQYGPWVGVPLYAFAGFVGYQRVDNRSHYVSDVIAGAVIGTAIGHTVSGNMSERYGVEVEPYIHEHGAVGLSVTRRW